MEGDAAATGSEPLIIGRYALFDALAAGGMATVHLGRLLGAVGFGRTVAVKRLHSQFATDHDFVTMFFDEARIVARIRHPNVVPMIDVIESAEGLFLVMEYVHGESYSKLLRTARQRQQMVPLKIVAAIMQGLLMGLHAAHETTGGNGELIDVVHRDVSPQNVIVGADGVARVLDFGVAKAAGRAQVTREGQIKGKLAYMAPEQIRGMADRRADVFAASVVLWESLAGRRLHEGMRDVEIVARVTDGGFQPPSQHRPEITPELDAIVMKGLALDREARYQNARQMALDLERVVGIASATEIAEWVELLASDALAERAGMVSAMEKASMTLVPRESVAPVPAPEGESAQARRSAPDMAPHDSRSGSRRPVVPSVSDTVSRTAPTPLVTEMPARALPQRDHAVAIALLSFLGMLALVGIVLTVISLMARKPPAMARPAPTVSALPLASPPPVVSATPPASAVAAAPATSVAAAPVPAPRPDAGAVAVVPTVVAAPAVRPPPRGEPAKVTPKSKTACDPPYTEDETGHRKYKMECMTQD